MVLLNDKAEEGVTEQPAHQHHQVEDHIPPAEIYTNKASVGGMEFPGRVKYFSNL